MSSEPAATGTRERLLEAALRTLEHDGPEALQARKLAAEIGTSTMAVYTHFGGMPELFEAVVNEGFHRFADALAASEPTDDPVTDLFVQGLAYRRFALENPQLYRLMFGLTGFGRMPQLAQDLTVTGSPAAQSLDTTAFEHLTRAIDRVRAAGRIRDEDTVATAGQIWSVTHGFVLLEIAGYFGHEDHGLLQVLGPLMVNLSVGMGDSREAVIQSAAAALTQGRVEA